MEHKEEYDGDNDINPSRGEGKIMKFAVPEDKKKFIILKVKSSWAS